MSVKILVGDCRETLKTLPEKSVHMVVTSPPYWGLRSYLDNDDPSKSLEIGLEPTPALYVEHLVEVMREVKRVLRDDGTCWMVIGDSYATTSTGNRGNKTGLHGGQISEAYQETLDKYTETKLARPAIPSGLKPKDIVGIPWSVAFALRDDGWWLRSSIIWAKGISFASHKTKCPHCNHKYETRYSGSCMPGSQRDRPTTSYENVFLLAKGQWVSRVVKLSNLPSEFIHFSYDRGFQSPSAGSGEISIRLATTILDFAKREYGFCLTPFDSEIGQKKFNDVTSPFVCGLPVEHRAAILSARLLGSHISTKEFLHQLNGLGIALSNSDARLICGSSAMFPLPPGVYIDGEATIAIHHSGKISKFDFVHRVIITQSPRSCKYYYDNEAVKEPSVYAGDNRGARADSRRGTECNSVSGETGATRTLRSVWAINPRGYKEAHFATFPTTLVTPMMMAGTSERGACPDCGAPWERVIQKPDMSKRPTRGEDSKTETTDEIHISNNWAGTPKSAGQEYQKWRNANPDITLGWRPGCGCYQASPWPFKRKKIKPDMLDTALSLLEEYSTLPTVPCVALDPFGGAGTVGVVATQLGRDAILCELNEEYCEMSRRRIEKVEPIEHKVKTVSGSVEAVAVEQSTMFPVEVL